MSGFSDIRDIFDISREQEGTKLVTAPVKDRNSRFLQPLRPKRDESRKVFRYRPGQAPKWAEGEEEEDFASAVQRRQRSRRGVTEEVDSRTETGSAAPEVNAAEDRRLRRLNRAREAIADRRSGRSRRAQVETEVVEEEEEEMIDATGGEGVDIDATGGSDDVDYDAVGDTRTADAMEEETNVDRRERVRQRLRELRMKSDEKEEMKVEEEEDELQSEDESSELDTESESDSEDAVSRPKLFRPVFKRKEQRTTVQTQEEKEAEEKAREEEKAKEAERRKEESKKLVAEVIRKEEEDAEAKAREEDEDGGRPDDTDLPEEEEEDFEAWKVRELKRLKRDREERERLERERKETERRRNLTDEERAREDRELEKKGLKVFKKEKSKLNFLQKYYHKGAFYMDEDSTRDERDVRRRAYNEATGMDKFDKSQLPEVMQVKNFGLRSRSKWTHLAAEDTTQKDMPWFQPDGYRTQYLSSMPGVKGKLDEAGRVVRGQKRRKIEEESRRH